MQIKKVFTGICISRWIKVNDHTVGCLYVFKSVGQYFLYRAYIYITSKICLYSHGKRKELMIRRQHVSYLRMWFMLIRGKYFTYSQNFRRTIIGHFKSAEWLIIGMTNSEIIKPNCNMVMLVWYSKCIWNDLLPNFL